MKALAGFLFFMLFLAGIAFVLLQGRQMAERSSAGGGAVLTGTQWRPLAIGDDAVDADSGLFIIFDPDGGITGHAGCNRFFGSLESTDAGLSVGPLGATRMACPEPVMTREFAFLEAIQQMTSFAVTRRGVQLLDQSDNVLVRLTEGDSEQ